MKIHSRWLGRVGLAAAMLMTCQARFVRVAADQAGGDSGGPWLWTNGTGTNRAYGIHKGGASTWSVFSKLSSAPASTRLRYNY